MVILLVCCCKVWLIASAHLYPLSWYWFDNLFQVIAILDKIKAEKEIAADEEEEEFESSDSPQDDKDWEGDDPDEDIIYVK